MSTNPAFTFFGSSRFSVHVLDELQKLGFMPRMIVTTPDKPQGRKLMMTPNVVKTWALEHNIPVLTPAKLDASFIETIRSSTLSTRNSGLGTSGSELFTVASYGKILPKELIELPPHKTLNIHPSLLPHYRGASPLQTAILNDAKDTGVSIMRIDEQMDHGPVVAQKKISIEQWPTYEIFEGMMAREGSRLLAKILPDWIAGKITEKEQDHSAATFTKKIRKGDGLIDLSADQYENFRKIQAYHEWPQAYFIVSKDGKDMRVKITSATFTNGTLQIEKVIPEGKSEMSYRDFLSGYRERQ